jgi:hypothetical protein
MWHLLQQHIAWHASSAVWTQQVCVEQQHKKLAIGLCKARTAAVIFAAEQPAEQITQAAVCCLQPVPLCTPAMLRSRRRRQNHCVPDLVSRAGKASEVQEAEVRLVSCTKVSVLVRCLLGAGSATVLEADELPRLDTAIQTSSDSLLSRSCWCRQINPGFKTK